MLYSMTGFGKAEANVDDILVQVEIRTLNSKGLDVNVRLPQNLKFKELEIRNLASQELKRGKVDIFVSIDMPTNEQVATINKEAFKAYLDQINDISQQEAIQNENVLETILKLPNVLIQTEEEIDENTWIKIEAVHKEALSKVNAFRQKEGDKMQSVLEQAIHQIKEELTMIPQYETERITKVRERMVQNLTSIQDKVEIDENRLEQELVYYIEKFDITEEKVRLSAHLDHFLDFLNKKEAITKGKKLSFISQEIGREVNTIGSKANHLAIQKHVVDMKDSLEQIKEQLSNIL